MEAEGRITTIGAIAITGSGAVLFASLFLLVGGPYKAGYAIIAIFLSAAIWWTASVVGEVRPGPATDRIANHLNALAAASAAYAGFLTTKTGWNEVLALFGPG